MFLSWLDVFMRPKNSKSNVINSLGTSLAIDEAIEHESSMDAYPPPSESGTDKDSSTEFSVQKKRRVNRDGVFEEISSYFKDRKERKEQSKDPDDVFGMMVAAELKSFSEERKYKIKHEINQVLCNNHVAIGPSSSNLTYIQPQVVSKKKHFPQVIFNDWSSTTNEWTLISCVCFFSCSLSFRVYYFLVWRFDYKTTLFLKNTRLTFVKNLTMPALQELPALTQKFACFNIKKCISS